MSIIIPDDILRATKLNEDELKLEIAIMLYKQEKISSGKARAWTGLTVIEFQHESAKRGLYRTHLRSHAEAASRLSMSLTKQRLILVVA